MRRELIFAGLELVARLEREHAADEHPGLVDHAFALQQSAMSRMPEPRGMLTTLSCGSGPGASKRCLPTQARRRRRPRAATSEA